MVLGALVDAGLPLTSLAEALHAVDLTGYELLSEPVAQHSITGTRVIVRLQDPSEQPTRSWADIRNHD